MIHNQFLLLYSLNDAVLAQLEIYDVSYYLTLDFTYKTHKK